MDGAVLEFLQHKQISSKLRFAVTADDLNILKHDLARMKTEKSAPSDDYCEKILKILSTNLCIEDSSEDKKIIILECLEAIFSFAVIGDWKYVGAVFINCLTIISSPSNNDGCSVKECSEELKEHVLKLIKAVVKQAVLRRDHEIFQQSFAPSVGHAIFVLLSIAKAEKARNLRIVAFDVLQTFLNFKDDPELVAGRFASFLPGITICCTHIINSDFKQQQEVTVAALKVWQAVVTKVLADSLCEDVNQPGTDVKKDFGGDRQFPEVKRTKQWRDDTATKLNVLVKEIVKIVTHDNWKVRFALLECAEELLFNCFSSLNDSLNVILQAVITLHCDDYREVSEKSEELIGRFSSFYSSRNDRSLRDKLSEDVHLLTTKLPRVIRTLDDLEKQSTLNLLIGYLQLLGPQIKHLLQSLPHLERLILALLQITEFETLENRILQQQPSDTINLSENILDPSCDVFMRWPKKSFKHFRERKIFDSIIRICKILGYYGDVSLLCDCLLEKAQASLLYRKQVILILSYVFLGTRGIDNLPGCSERNDVQDEIFDLVRYAIDVYLSPAIWCVCTDLSREKSTANASTISSTLVLNNKENDIVTMEKVRSNVLQKCLLLEGFAHFAQVRIFDVDKIDGFGCQVLETRFGTLLLDVLYPVLEQVGSSSVLIAHTAEIALQSIAESCGYRNVNDLITNNADYLVNSLSLKLCHYIDNEDAAVVLDVTLQLCNSDILLLVQDSLNQVFYVIDRHQSHNIQPLLKVLQSLMLGIQKRSAISPVVPKSDLVKSSVAGQACTMKDFLLQYHKMQTLSRDMDDVSDDGTEHTEPQNGEPPGNNDFDSDFVPDKKPELPLEIRMTLKVLERCRHMQNSPDKFIQLLVLDIIQQGICILASHEDQLLPMVHKLWSPFVQRFSDKEPVVIMKALDILIVLADSCAEFVQKRTRENVWPKIGLFLEKQSKTSLGKANNSPFTFTFGYKLQFKVLNVIGPLAKKLNFQESHLETVCSAVFPYLDDSQPQSLQEAAMSTFRYLMELDPDLVWFFLRLASPTEFARPRPAPHFHPVRFGRKGASLPSSENVAILLKELEL